MSVTVSLEELLWSTRGEKWGWRFLHEPPNDSSVPDFWRKIRHQLFRDIESTPVFWHGKFNTPNGSINYIACRIHDPVREWRDESGRLIPQEFFLVIRDTQSGLVIAPAWSESVMDVLRPYYEQIYDRDEPPDSIDTEVYATCLELDTSASKRRDMEMNPFLEKREKSRKSENVVQDFKKVGSDVVMNCIVKPSITIIKGFKKMME